MTEGLRLMLAGSYENVGVKDIVEAAGVPKGSFYYYFESKEAFGDAVVERYARLAERERDWVLATAEGTAPAKVRAYFQHLAASYRRRKFAEGCLFGNLAVEMADRSERLRARIHSGLSGWETALAHILASDGSLPPRASPEDVARHLVQSWEGALVRMRVEKTDRPLDLFFRFAFDPILNTG